LNFRSLAVVSIYIEFTAVRFSKHELRIDYVPNVLITSLVGAAMEMQRL
jgi:hypothetical protein